MILSNIRPLDPFMPNPDINLTDDLLQGGITSDQVFDAMTGYVSNIIPNKIDNFIGYLDGLFAPSDTGAIDQYLQDSDYFYDKLKEVAELQNKQAQASADRAMEFNADQAAINRQWQEQQNQKAMDFSERMSNTSYQRSMADLKAAGLNPKLVGQLSGASTPAGISSSGSVASGSPASIAAADLAPMASILNTYITGADAMDRQNRDFVQGILTTLLESFLNRRK